MDRGKWEGQWWDWQESLTGPEECVYPWLDSHWGGSASESPTTDTDTREVRCIRQLHPGFLSHVEKAEAQQAPRSQPITFQHVPEAALLCGRCCLSWELS